MQTSQTERSKLISVQPSGSGSNSLRQMLLAWVVAGSCLGCSSDTSDSLQSMQDHVGTLTGTLDKMSLEAPEMDEGKSAIAAGIPVAKTEMPSPGRINAFEMSGEYRSETPNQELGGKREVYIIGFVEVDEPSVMLAIDGRTHVLKKGDTSERITVQEIDPPRARLTCDGVSWNASIFDRRNTTSEALSRKRVN